MALVFKRFSQRTDTAQDSKNRSNPKIIIFRYWESEELRTEYRNYHPGSPTFKVRTNIRQKLPFEDHPIFQRTLIFMRPLKTTQLVRVCMY